MLTLKIIINCGACEAYIDQCLNSVQSQTYQRWDAYVTIDPWGDKTHARALQASRGETRVHITRNAKSRYSMANTVRAIRRSAAQPEDVVVILDGDDWLATDRALEIIVDTYEREDCWVTYGSWVFHVEDWPRRAYDASTAYKCHGQWPAYAEGTTDFRHADWRATAVRTWKKWLWDHIDRGDFCTADGRYVRVAEDVAIMLPLLEMSGTRKAKHIPEVLMVYNCSNPYSCYATKHDECCRITAYLRSKPPYRLLPEKVLVEPGRRRQGR